MGPDNYTEFQQRCEELLSVAKVALLDDINRNLASLLNNGRLADGSSPRGLSLSRFRPLEVSVALHTPDDAVAPIFEVSRHTLLASFGPGPIDVEIYDLPSSDPRIFKPDRKPHLQQVRTLEVGQHVFAQAHVHAFRVLPPTAHAVLLAIASPPVGGFTWEYDADTHRARRLMNSTVTETRMQYAARALAELGNADSCNVLKGLATHPNYAIRWEAVTSLIRLDPSCALTLLLGLQDDEHPMIRDAARATVKCNF